MRLKELIEEEKTGKERSGQRPTLLFMAWREIKSWRVGRLTLRIVAALVIFPPVLARVCSMTLLSTVSLASFKVSPA
jgi:hypothetical protein